jgi:two-component system, sensor histidine kinase
LSHDLKQPLTGLIGYLELAENQITQPAHAAYRDFIHRAQNSANAINRNLTRVLELARIQDIGYHTKATAVDLRELVNLVGKMYEAQVIAQNINFKIVTPANNAVFVNSNFDLLFQIIQNLIANSIKYRRASPVKTRIILSAIQLSNGLTKISVADNGIGIQPSDTEKIFEPYYQADNNERNNTKGLGLGLAFVREAINRLPDHHITLWSNATSVTKMNILLPTFTATAIVSRRTN